MSNLVEYFEVKNELVDGVMTRIKVRMGQAEFMALGVAYEEFEAGAGNYSTAVIRLDDGSVRNIPVELVRFIDAGSKST